MTAAAVALLNANAVAVASAQTNSSFQFRAHFQYFHSLFRCTDCTKELIRCHTVLGATRALLLRQVQWPSRRPHLAFHYVHEHL
jgi:hypothetical protein